MKRPDGKTEHRTERRPDERESREHREHKVAPPIEREHETRQGIEDEDRQREREREHERR